MPDDPGAHPLLADLVEQDLIRPLSARSLIASTLLGTHPPRLPGPLLIAFASEFGIPAGTVRVALSRMVERGELTNDDGVYALAGPLLARQARQDRGRLTPEADADGVDSDPWNGEWIQALVVLAGRSAADRSRLRTELGRLGLAERREGVWMRPDNLDVVSAAAALDPELFAQLEWHRSRPVDAASTAALAHELFDLDSWAHTAGVLVAAVEGTSEAITADPDLPLSVPFHVAAAALRHLGNDPLLPAPLLPCGWPGTALRSAYDALDAVHGRHLRQFFAGVREVRRARPG